MLTLACSRRHDAVSRTDASPRFANRKSFYYAICETLGEMCTWKYTPLLEAIFVVFCYLILVRAGAKLTNVQTFYFPTMNSGTLLLVFICLKGFTNAEPHLLTKGNLSYFYSIP